MLSIMFVAAWLYTSCFVLSSAVLLTPTSIITGVNESYVASASSEFQDDVIICTTPSCHVRCANTYSCRRLKINASDSDSLQITCSDYNACQSLTIIKSAISSTSIECPISDSCRQIQLDLGNSASSDITCGDFYSCSSLNLIQSSWQSTWLHCQYHESCSSLQLNFSNSESSHIRCSGGWSCGSMQIMQSSWVSTDIHCSSDACYSANFDVRNSANTNLTCSSYSACSSVSVQGSYQTTTVQCAEGACQSATFNVTHSSAAHIDCASWDSCSYSTVIATDTAKLNMSCQSSSSCRSMQVYVTDPTVNVVNLECVYYDSCEYLTSHCATTSSQVTIDWNTGKSWCNNDECCLLYDGYLDCIDQDQTCVIDCTLQDCSNHFIDGSNVAYSLTVNCNSTHGGCADTVVKCPDTFSFATCSVNCHDDEACSDITIKGTESYELDVDCAGSEACVNALIYCPYDREGACSISCNPGDYRVCYNMDIWSNESYVDDFLSLDCGSRSNNEECTNTYIQCSTDGQQYDRDGETRYGVYVTYYSHLNEWDCADKSTAGCCPCAYPVVCDTDDCSVDCSVSECAELTINASDASRLTVDCGYYECQQSTVVCASSECSITCDSTNACRNMVVYADDTSTVTIDCTHSAACNYMRIFVENANEFTFISDGSDSRGVTIFADNAGNVNLGCKGDYACYQMQFYGTNAASITLDAGYNYGFYSGTFRAGGAGAVSIRCTAYVFGYSCYDASWYLPDYGVNTNFECYGIGCYNLGSIYVNNSISGLAMTVNGCGKCASLETCLSSWIIYCTPPDSANLYSRNSMFYGSCQSDTCDCTDFGTALTFIDNQDDENCDISNVDEDTTTTATVSVTTTESDKAGAAADNNDDDENNAVGMDSMVAMTGWLVAALGIVLCIVLIIMCRSADRRAKYFGATYVKVEAPTEPGRSTAATPIQQISSRSMRPSEPSPAGNQSSSALMMVPVPPLPSSYVSNGRGTHVNVGSMSPRSMTHMIQNGPRLPEINTNEQENEADGDADDDDMYGVYSNPRGASQAGSVTEGALQITNQTAGVWRR